MHEEFYEWFDRFVSRMNKNLARYNPRNDGTGENERFRRYYIRNRDGKERFIVHLRATPTKKRINVLFGLREEFLRLPEGCPELEYNDKSVPNYREFNLNMNDTHVEEITLDLAKQIAEYHTR